MHKGMPCINRKPGTMAPKKSKKSKKKKRGW